MEHGRFLIRSLIYPMLQTLFRVYFSFAFQIISPILAVLIQDTVGVIFLLTVTISVSVYSISLGYYRQLSGGFSAISLARGHMTLVESLFLIPQGIVAILSILFQIPMQIRNVLLSIWRLIWQVIVPYLLALFVGLSFGTIIYPFGDYLHNLPSAGLGYFLIVSFSLASIFPAFVTFASIDRLRKYVYSCFCIYLGGSCFTYALLTIQELDIEPTVSNELEALDNIIAPTVNQINNFTGLFILSMSILLVIAILMQFGGHVATISVKEGLFSEIKTIITDVPVPLFEGVDATSISHESGNQRSFFQIFRRDAFAINIIPSCFVYNFQDGNVHCYLVDSFGNSLLLYIYGSYTIRDVSDSDSSIEKKVSNLIVLNRNVIITFSV